MAVFLLAVFLGDGQDYVLQVGSLFRVEGDINFGPGNDVLQTNGLLSVGGVGDGGAGYDEVYFWDTSGRLRDFPAQKIKNFEASYQQGGLWEYSGDITHIPSVVISGVGDDFRGGAVQNIAGMRASAPARFDGFILNDAEAIVLAYLDEGKSARAPISVEGAFEYKNGRLAVLVNLSGEDASDPVGVWRVISGEVANPEELAKNTEFYFGSSLRSGDFGSEVFEGIGVVNKLDSPAYYDIYLEKGSLNLVVEEKEEEQIICELGFDDDCGELRPEGGW